MTEKLILHGMSSPNVTKVVLMLEECALDYELRHVAVFAQEIADLVQAGCRYLQIDEIAVALLCDPAIRDRVAVAGGEVST